MMGRLDVDRMLSEVSASQWLEWEAFYAIEKFGPRQDDYRAGIVAEMIATANGVKLSDGSTPTLKTWFPDSPLLIDWKAEEKKLADYAVMMRDIALAQGKAEERSHAESDSKDV